MPNDVYRERHLPHQVPSGYPIFLNWNLKGSVPRHVIDELDRELQRLNNQPRRERESDAERKIRHSKILFARRDASLDRDFQSFLSIHDNQTFAFEGRPMWLADPFAAYEVLKSFLWGVETRYRLWAFTVMGNHVHAFLTPEVDLEVVTQGIKGFTAYQINRLHNAKWRTFWQDESFDHWARDDDEFFRIIDYIEQNPVVAGLCKQEEQWIWSSAWLRERIGWQRGEPFPTNRKEEATQLIASTLPVRQAFEPDFCRPDNLPVTELEQGKDFNS